MVYDQFPNKLEKKATYLRFHKPINPNYCCWIFLLMLTLFVFRWKLKLKKVPTPLDSLKSFEAVDSSRNFNLLKLKWADCGGASAFLHIHETNLNVSTIQL